MTKKIELDHDETVDLIEMHGKMIVDACECPNCHEPIKELMLLKIERMRELIMMLPDHVQEIEFEPEERTAH